MTNRLEIASRPWASRTHASVTARTTSSSSTCATCARRKRD